MKFEVKVPEIGESITEVTLSEWFKEDGDYVEMDEPICEFESDKATLELPAEKAGVITRKASEGDDLEIGALIAVIDTDAEAPEDSGEKEAEKPEKKEKSEADDKKPDDTKEEDKADKEEDKPKKKSEPKEEPAGKKEEKKEEKKEDAGGSRSAAKSHASPAARKILEEKDIDPKAVKGSGPGGRITKEDAEKAAPGIKEWAEEEKKKEQRSTGSELKSAVIQGDFSREERTEKMSRLRRTISRRLVAAKNETAMLTTFNDVDMSRILEIRKAYKEEFRDEHDINLGFMSFFTKACSIALSEFPAINAYLEEDHIQYHDYADISIAVSTPKGLVVPVIRNAESLSMAEIEKEVKRLAIAGRDGELSLEDMQGGTFTISNGGVFGSLLSTPIINQPQSAILGLHRIEERPVAIDGEVVIRPMMYLALSYDHRIVDGKESVTFLVRIKELIESPEKMLFGGDPMRTLLDI